MGENAVKTQIKEQLGDEFKKYFGGGCFWKNINNNLTIGIVIDNIGQVIEKLVQVASQHSKLTNYELEANNVEEIKKIINNSIMPQLRYSVNTFLDNPDKPLRFLNNLIDLTIPISIKLQNGKVIERKFGTKEDGQQYIVEEVKVILKEAEEIECDEKFKDGRLDKFTFLSMIVDIDTSISRGQYPLIVVAPDNKDKDKVYKEIKQAVNKAKQDCNSPDILLIPYSADGHIVTLLVDKSKVHISKTGEVSFSKDSIMCFDSSHYFTGYIGNGFSKRFFPKEIYKALENKKLPINKKAPQQKEGTCSFYTEAFCYVISDYIRLNPKATLDEVQKYVNTPDVKRLIEYYKNLFFNEYKATMEEVKQKQEQQKQKIKKEITDNITVQQNGQLTPDEQHYQQLLNQYGICMYGQEFMGDINGIDGINNSNPFNPDQQNALVQEFIGSDVITRLNGGREIIVGFNHNREAFINTVYDAQQPNNVLNNGTVPVNFIYTLGTERNQNPDAGTHYVAGQIFRDPITNELVVLHYDSLNGTVSDEFEQYIRNEFGRDIQIVNISNENRFTQQEQGAYTCGLCALTALRDNGILDQRREEYIMEHNLSQVTNLDIPNIQQQTPKTPTLPIAEDSPNTSQFSPHSITPSKTSSEQNISSSSSSTTEHSQTPQQQTATQSQNSQFTQSQLQQSQIISSLVNTQANNVSHNEPSQQSTPPQTPISPPSRSSSPLMGGSNN